MAFAQYLSRTRRQLLRRLAFSTAYGGGVAGLAGSLWYCFETREQTFQPFNEASDPLAQNDFYKACNPRSNETSSDIYVARVPLSQVRPDLVEDYKRGARDWSSDTPPAYWAVGVCLPAYQSSLAIKIDQQLSYSLCYSAADFSQVGEKCLQSRS